MEIKFYIIPILLFLIVLTFGQDISFEKEILNIHVSDSTCTLAGKYFLQNHSKKPERYPIYYPIAINEQQKYPHFIKIEDDNQNKIPYKKVDGGVRFSLATPADTTLPVRIEYRQNISSNNFEYILESTQSWGEPLKNVKIVIHVPKTIRLTNTTFKYNYVENRGDELVYIIDHENFFPKKNLKIYWKEY